MTTVKGLILKEINRGEASKSVCVLTAEMGVIYVFIRGGQKSSKTSCLTQAYTYCVLCLEQKRDAKGQVSYFLNSGEPIKMFYNIRLDAKRLALASYLSQLLIYSGTESSGNEDVMRLTLNCLYFLNQGKMDMELIKSIFELRLLCEIGLMPNLIGCCKCFKYESDKMHFNFLSNSLFCDSCCESPESFYDCVLDKTLLYIVRYIALSEFERLFAFKISQKYQQKLTDFTERFTACHFKRKFATLDFYKML